MVFRNPLIDKTLKSALDACDALEELRSESSSGRRDPSKVRWRARLRNATRDGRATGRFDVLASELELDDDERVVLAVALHADLVCDERVTGRDLLWALCDSTYELLGAVELLDAGGRLRGALMADEDDEALVDTTFGLTPDAMQRLRTESNHSDEVAQGFADGTDYLLEVRELALACQRRAAGAFAESLWAEVHDEPVGDATRAVSEARQQLRTRLAATEEPSTLALHRLACEHHLRADEIVIIVTLICREALSGAPAIETIDLLRMVCSDERDLLRRRRLLGPRAPLVVAGLIEVEESEFVGATSVARIAPWVSAQILDEPRKQGRPIAPDDRIEFHDFIVGLDGSDPFFENL